MSNTTTPKNIHVCSVSGCDRLGIFKCVACHKFYCATHIGKHRCEVS